MVPRREALLGKTFETRKMSSRRPAIASAITNSASPYISAVSMWVMPRSTPRRSAAMASLRSPRSIYQVPCPITDTSHLLLPNSRDFMVMVCRRLRHLYSLPRRGTRSTLADVYQRMAAMHCGRVLGLQTAQPVAEADDLGTVCRARRRNQPVPESGSLAHAVAAIARVVAETAADEQVDLALDELVQPRRLQHPQAYSSMRRTELRKRQAAQVEAGVQTQVQQHPTPRRLQLCGRIGDATKAAGYLGQVDLAGRRQNKLLMQPLEQAHLQRFHLLPDGGRRHM